MSQENQNDDSLKMYELVKHVEGDETPQVMATVAIHLDESENLAIQPAPEKKEEKVDSAELIELQKKYDILMSSLPVGLLVVNEKLEVGPEYTNVCADIFGQADLENKNLLDLLNASDEERSTISDYLKSFIQTLGEPGTVNPIEILDIIPPSQESEESENSEEIAQKESRQIRIGYQMISQAADGSAQVLVIIEDITPIKTANEGVERIEKNMQRLGTIIVDPDLSAELLSEQINCVDTAIDNLTQLKESPDKTELIASLSLNVHKIAGLSIGFGEDHIIDQSEKLLDTIRQVINKKASDDWMTSCESLLNELSETISNFSESFQELTGLEIEEQPVKKLKIMGQNLTNLAETLRKLKINAEDKAQLIDQVNELKSVSVYDGFSRTARLIQGIIDITGESAAFSIEDSDIMMDYALAQSLSEPLVHLFMHIMKHNIDAPEARFDRNKVEEANISIAVLEDEDGLVVEMSDDGEGLDPETVKQTVVEKELMTQEAVDEIPDDETLELIFTPGYYSDADIQSGMQLDQIRHVIQDEMGAEMFVDAEPGEGTTFMIKFQDDKPAEPAESKTVKQVYGYNAGYYYLFEIDASGDCRASKVEKDEVPSKILDKWLADGTIAK
ncbi:MAG: Chemotaxis protein CheA [Candidatus Magnetoglobus multicellularis str. Araruama]|uniref:Chemotaxis protein CheA n=1 Tax=Candidatus Magnetoglobus multicellularis str. Araruama TaxID=890399 RepID=A0A1V1PDF2_9BACT|nr:MAG: Chemotaxis protein CheA [Candidatus Magnetoglobus multicellularis str. Araruama]